MKALGTGTRGVRWRDIEVVRRPGGPPTVRLHGSARHRAERIGLDHLALSLSHSREYAVASVVGQASMGTSCRPGPHPDSRRIPPPPSTLLPKSRKDEAVRFDSIGRRW